MQRKKDSIIDYVDLYDALRTRGFNLLGAVPVKEYDDRAPEGYQLREKWPWARSVLGIGTGGSDFWASIERKKGHPKKNPIDRATVNRLRRFPNMPEGKHLWVFPFRPSGEKVSFRRLGEMAGFGVSDTILGILIHPHFGPWVSLRAALLLEAELPRTEPLESFNPCGPCSKPCQGACPAMAVRTTGVDFGLCGSHLLKSNSCDKGCLARRACVYGQEEMYGEEENQHRQSAANEIMRKWAQKTQVV